MQQHTTTVGCGFPVVLFRDRMVPNCLLLNCEIHYTGFLFPVKKKNTARRKQRAVFGTSGPVSRVLSFKTAIYLGAALPLRSSHLLNAAGPAYVRFHGVAPDRVYSDEQFPVIGRALISAFPPLPPISLQKPEFLQRTHDGGRRYISVALFLKSPSAGVTRYPCPVEPGLSS